MEIIIERIGYIYNVFVSLFILSIGTKQKKIVCFRLIAFCFDILIQFGSIYAQNEKKKQFTYI